MTTITGECHPACLQQPEIGQAEFDELVEDIRAHGQRHAIGVDDRALAVARGGALQESVSTWRSAARARA
jgi:hypothetical protein